MQEQPQQSDDVKDQLRDAKIKYCHDLIEEKIDVGKEAIIVGHALLDKATLLEGQGRTEEARASYERIIEKYGASSDPRVQQLVQITKVALAKLANLN